MGKIASATTVYSVAYLTEKGRSYLFGKDSKGTPNRFVDGEDNFEIAYFALFDSDTNYRSSSLLETGDVPDVTGTSDTCLNTAPDYSPKWNVAWKGQIPPADITYVVSPKSLTINTSNL